MRLINADEVEKYLWDYIDGYEIPGVLEAISKMPTIEVPDILVGKSVEDGNVRDKE